jgi:HSP20 family protein
MALVKWEQLSDIEAMVDRALHWPMARLSPTLTTSELGPRVDIREDDGTYLIKDDIPGMAKEDISVSLSGDMLTIQGERQRESEEKKAHFHRIERTYGSFCRSFSLPADADTSSINAHCDKGELTIRIAKAADLQGNDARPIPVE